MMLINNGFPSTTMINFGQPRVGDKTYAAFSNAHFPNQWRHVHFQDIVPHNPSDGFPFYFWHTATEIYEDKTSSTYKMCNSTGEDPTCADQWFLLLDVASHLMYMGECMSSTCG